MRSASQSPRRGASCAAFTWRAAACQGGLLSPGHKFASQGSLFSLADADEQQQQQQLSPRSTSAPRIPTPALLLVPSQVPRARSDALDLFFSAFLSSFTLSKGMANLLYLALLFSALSTAISAATAGSGLRGLGAALLPWLRGALLCPEAARDAAVLAVLLAVCLALATGSYCSMAAFARSSSSSSSSSAAAASADPAPSHPHPHPHHSEHARNLLLRHLLCTSAYLLFAVAFMASVTVSPLWACLGLIVAFCILLKLHSWTMTNLAMCREQALVRGGGWPRNVNAANFAYFLCAPTLVYESVYPRSPAIRPLFLLCKALQAGVASGLGLLVLFNCILPVLTTPTPPGSLTALPARLQAPAAFLADLVRLAMPSIVLWICAFFVSFSCLLGILAELTQFSDREFFGPFWDATSLGSFWSLWNKPVHRWCKRRELEGGGARLESSARDSSNPPPPTNTSSLHPRTTDLLIELQVYLHLKKRGAVLATFVLSAVLHELILSTAFKTTRVYFFVAMCLQLPLIWLSRASAGGSGSSLGNTLVWVSLFCGQPVLELLYAREFLQVPGRQGSDLLCMR